MLYCIEKKGNVLIFTRDHGKCYGGEHETFLDTLGKEGIELYKHIKEYAGSAPAKAAKEQGYCD